MKKILGIIIVSAFILSLLGSALPGMKEKVISITGSQAYASTSLPLPPSIGLAKNLAEKAK